MAELTSQISGFLRRRQAPVVAASEGEMVTINEAVGALAFYYEKVRTMVEFHDDHLLRQNAIRRILNRRLIFSNSLHDIALALLKELTRSRYLRNNTISEGKVREIEQILGRYEGIADSLRKRGILSDRDQDWLYSIASCAIDEALSPMQEEEALVHLMFEMLEPHINPPGYAEQDKMRKMQIYIAVYKVLMKPNIYRLRYFLLKARFVDWHHGKSTQTEHLAAQFKEVQTTIDEVLENPLNKKLTISLARYRIPFIVLHTILKNNPADILNKPDELDKEVVRICEGLYRVQRRRLVGRTTRAFVYLFITKMALGLSLEIPYDLFVYGTVHALPVAINVLFPPLFLVVIALSAPTPKKDNTEAIVQAVREIVYKEVDHTIFVNQSQRVTRRGLALNVFFAIVYIALFALSFASISWILHLLDFNMVSVVVFYVFLSLVTFFALNLRRSSKDLMIVRRKPSLLGSLIDLMMLPIMKVGYWLSANIAKVNIFVVIFDLLIELPFQAVIEITEEWFSFVREKKDELE